MIKNQNILINKRNSNLPEILWGDSKTHEKIKQSSKKLFQLSGVTKENSISTTVISKYYAKLPNVMEIKEPHEV